MCEVEMHTINPHTLPKVDEPYLVTFCCLLTYATKIWKVEIYVHLHLYMKKPKLNPKSFGSTFELL